MSSICSAVPCLGVSVFFPYLADLTREVLWLKRHLLTLGAPEVVLNGKVAPWNVLFFFQYSSYHPGESFHLGRYPDEDGQLSTYCILNLSTYNAAHHLSAYSTVLFFFYYPCWMVTDMNAENEVRRAVGLLQPPLLLDEEKQVVRVLESVSFSTRPGIDLVELCDNARHYPTVFTRAAIELQLVYPHNQLVHVISDVAMLSVVLAMRPKDCPTGERNQHDANLMTFPTSGKPCLSLSVSLSVCSSVSLFLALFYCMLRFGSQHWLCWYAST